MDFHDLSSSDQSYHVPYLSLYFSHLPLATKIYISKLTLFTPTKEINRLMTLIEISGRLPKAEVRDKANYETRSI